MKSKRMIEGLPNHIISLNTNSYCTYLWLHFSLEPCVRMLSHVVSSRRCSTDVQDRLLCPEVGVVEDNSVCT